MTTKKTQTQAEVRAAMVRQLAEHDLKTVEAVAEIMGSDEMTALLDQLEALGDPTDAEASQRSPTQDVNALVANLALPIKRAMELCDFHRRTLDARLNPPEPAPLPVLTPIPPAA